MHILFVTGEYPPDPGGIGDYTQQLSAALCARGHTVGALTIRGGQLLYYSATDQQPAQALGPARSWGWPIWRSIGAALKRIQPDIVHIQYQTGAYAMHPAINLLPWRLGLRSGGPLTAVTFHDLLEPYLFPKAGPLRRLVNLRLARDADLTIATNQPDCAQLAAYRRRGSPAPTRIAIGSNIAVAPPAGYSRAAWRAQLGVGPATLLIGYFGLISASKGLDLLIEAFAERPEARLLIIGGAASAPPDRAFAQQIEARSAALGLGQRIIRTGHLSPADVSASLLACDIVALPFRDGASFRRGSLLAALAHSCAVITTSPADQEAAAWLRDGEQALLITPSSTALGRALARLAADPALRERIGAAGQALASSFGWPTIAQRHEEIYRSAQR